MKVNAICIDNINTDLILNKRYKVKYVEYIFGKFYILDVLKNIFLKH